jgi:SAM-dependent methyltransferase
MSDIPKSMLALRQELSECYLAGDGIEIGALHHPLHVSSTVRVKYVDRLPVNELRRHYPELGEFRLIEPDIVDDGETLASIPAESLDFIIANHMLEHCENPLGTIRAHLARLKPDGILYYAVPDKRHTFDENRQLTAFSHLVEDDQQGPERSRRQHYREWATLVNRLTTPEAIQENIDGLFATRYSIHFHVWDATSFRDFLVQACSYLGRSFTEIRVEPNESEIIAVLRKVKYG